MPGLGSLYERISLNKAYWQLCQHNNLTIVHIIIFNRIALKLKTLMQRKNSTHTINFHV